MVTTQPVVSCSPFDMFGEREAQNIHMIWKLLILEISYAGEIKPTVEIEKEALCRVRPWLLGDLLNKQGIIN